MCRRRRRRRRRRKKQEGSKETGDKPTQNQSRSDQFLARKGLTIMTRPEGPALVGFGYEGQGTLVRRQWAALPGCFVSCVIRMGGQRMSNAHTPPSIPFAHEGHPCWAVDGRGGADVHAPHWGRDMQTARRARGRQKGVAAMG
jgi:hypothetical protein